MRVIPALAGTRWPLRRAVRAETRLLARDDGSPRPDGVFTPEAERKVRESLGEGLAGHRAADAERLLTAPVASPEIKLGQQPYPDIAASQLAAYRYAAAAGQAAPEFHPVPGRAAETAPMAAVPNVKVPPPPPARGPAHASRVVVRTTAAGVTDVMILRRVRDGLERKWRAESFVADKGDLPLFDAVTRELGWQGLHMPPQSTGWQRWSTERWAARERALAGAAHAKALAELDEIHARHAALALADGSPA